jgi:hypothetical protein
MGISAFFWMPLIGERQYLADTAYKISVQYIGEHFWTWRNFLDTTFAFEYTFAIPFQVGLVQLALAAFGVGLARRRDAEWWFLLAVTLLAGLGITRPTLPLWLNHSILLVAQFPWRLLGIISLPLAVFAAGCLQPLRGGRWHTAGAVALLGLIIMANRPRLDWLEPLAMDDPAIYAPSVTQFETSTRAVGTGSAQEFMPRWVESLELDPATVTPPAAAPLDLRLEAAGPYAITLAVSTPTTQPVRFTDFFYPNWQAVLEDGRALTTYPTTNMGLLTVDVPAGTHRVRVSWQETALQRWATRISLATLGLLGIAMWFQKPWRWLTSLPLSLLIIGAGAAFAPPAKATHIQSPNQLSLIAGVQLIGFRVERSDPSHLSLYPYWYVSSAPPSLRIRWLLKDRGGSLLSDSSAWPYFNSSRSDNWPAGTIVDDAYWLALPPGLPTGVYQLWLQFHLAETPNPNDVPATPAYVGDVAVTAVPHLSSPPRIQVMDFRFADQIALEGYAVSINGKAADQAQGPLVVKAGDRLEYHLTWRATAPVTENYHGFVHLLDAHQQALANHDHLPGSFFQPPVLWDPFWPQTDSYRLRIPETAPSGLYWPHVGLYLFDRVERLPVRHADGTLAGDHVVLPAIKVLSGQRRTPQNQVNARFEDLATFLGYDLALPASGLRPGSAFTLTLYYRSEQPLARDYTQFVHLHSPDLGMAAQYDSPPQRGGNPTSAWIPGEIIVEQIALRINQGARPGIYSLRVGLYDSQADGVRLPAQDQNGIPLPENQIVLAELRIAN